MFGINGYLILINSSLLSERNNKQKYIYRKIYHYFHFKVISVEKIIVHIDNLT